MDSVLGQSSNFNRNSILKRLMVLVHINDGIQSYMTEALNSLMSSLHINSSHFNACYLFRHSSKSVIYYGSPVLVDIRNKFVLDCRKEKPGCDVIDYSIETNWFHKLKSDDAAALTLLQANSVKVADDRKRKFDRHDDVPRSFRGI